MAYEPHHDHRMGYSQLRHGDSRGVRFFAITAAAILVVIVVAAFLGRTPGGMQTVPPYSGVDPEPVAPIADPAAPGTMPAAPADPQTVAPPMPEPIAPPAQ